MICNLNNILSSLYFVVGLKPISIDTAGIIFNLAFGNVIIQTFYSSRANWLTS